MDEQLPDSDAVLPNKLGITDPEVLKTAETEICHIRTVELAVKPVGGSFDFAHLQRIHERLFGNIYDFAGKVRTVDIPKGHTTFCRAAYIDAPQCYSPFSRWETVGQYGSFYSSWPPAQGTTWPIATQTKKA